MRISIVLILMFFVAYIQAQSPCDKIQLYGDVVVKGDQPIWHKLKRFDPKKIPESTNQKMKSEIVKFTSAEFYADIKIKSVKLFDSAVANAWAWTNEPIADKDGNPVYFFYAVLFETKTTNNTPFEFRLDFLKDGDLLNEEQISFLKAGRPKTIGCKELLTLVSKDKIQPIKTVGFLSLAYSNTQQALIWTISSVMNNSTGVQYFKDVNAVTGEIIQRNEANRNLPLEEVKVQGNN